MVVGWATAPWHCACLIGAQLLAGLSMATFEGTMDTAVAKRYGDAATGPLAWTAFRALGGALAAGVTPMFVSKASLPAFGLIAAGILIALTIRGLAQRPQPARPRLSPTAQPDSA